MNKLILLCCLFLILSSARAQSVTPTTNFMSDVSGRVLLTKAPGYNIEGSYFYTPDYKKAILIFGNEKMYQDIAVKLNLLDNEVVFQAANGSDMVVSTPIREIRFTNEKTIFRNGFPAQKNLTPSTYYEILDTGKAMLLKHYAVTYWDDKPYNSPTPTRTYEQKTEYFVYTIGKMWPLAKGNAGAVLDILSDKKEAVSTFIKDNGLKFKKDEEYIAVFDYYNKHASATNQ